MSEEKDKCVMEVTKMENEKQIVEYWANRIFEAVSDFCEKSKHPLFCYVIKEDNSAGNLVFELANEGYFTEEEVKKIEKLSDEVQRKITNEVDKKILKAMKKIIDEYLKVLGIGVSEDKKQIINYLINRIFGTIIRKRKVKYLAEKIFRSIYEFCENDPADPLLCYETYKGFGTDSLIATFNDYLTEKEQKEIKNVMPVDMKREIAKEVDKRILKEMVRLIKEYPEMYIIKNGDGNG